VLLAGSEGEGEGSPWIVLVLVAIIACDSGRGGALGLETKQSGISHAHVLTRATRHDMSCLARSQVQCKRQQSPEQQRIHERCRNDSVCDVYRLLQRLT